MKRANKTYKLIVVPKAKKASPELWEAARKGNCKAVKDLLSQDDLDINTVGLAGETAFYRACAGGHLNVVKLFLEMNAELAINQANWDGITPIRAACRYGQVEVVKLLLKQRNIADINHADKRGNTMLHEVCKKFYPAKNEIRYEMLNLLLAEAGINVNEVNYNGNTPLHIACGSDNTQIIEMLLFRKEIKPNVLNCKDLTPQSIALQNPIGKQFAETFAKAMKDRVLTSSGLRI